MYTSPNIGLTVWDLPTDDFDHTQLEQNWIAVDNHDHSSGKGVQIGTLGIQPLAITNALLALGSVANANLQANSVATGNIQAGAVGNAQLAVGSVHGNVIPNAAITASMLDPTIVPLGGVMLLWRPPGSGATPGGFWEAMDGRAWSTITNAWNLTTGTIPDTRGIFAKGADINGVYGPAIGTTGGSASINFAHSHTVNPHSHTVPDHSHGIGADGLHLHTWQGGLSMWSRQNAFPMGLNFQAYNGSWQSNTYYSMYIKNLLSNPAWFNVNGNQTFQELDGPADMDQGGSHSHGGATQGSGTLTSGTTSGLGMDSQLGETGIDPPWTGLMFIMRCR
jgi:hypothetical protein